MPNEIKKRNYSPLADKNAYTFDDEDDKKQTIRETMSMVLRYSNKPIVKSDEEAEERITEYFQYCIDTGNRPLVEGLALALGTTRATLWDWETGRRGTISADLIKKAKENIALFDANLVAQGKLNPVTYIFRSKNYYGMKDQQEHVVTPNVQNVDRAVLIKDAEDLPDE